MNKPQIGTYRIGGENPCFIIAEVGINHNGDLGMAMSLIDAAKAAGCQAVKFQKRTVDVVYSPAELAKQRQVHRSILEAALKRGILGEGNADRLTGSGFEASTNGDLKRALEFSPDEYRLIDTYCRDKDILWSVSPWDEQAVDDIARFDPPFWKIASASLTDDGLLRKVREQGSTVILSTGMSTMEEVRHAVEVLGGRDLILLHTVSTYPAKEKELNLRVMETLKAAFPDVPVGYSGHENGTTLSVAARALGACVIERHITLDRTLPGSDHAASLEPGGISRVVTNIRRLEEALGRPEKTLLEAEVPIKAKLRRK